MEEGLENVQDAGTIAPMPKKRAEANPQNQVSQRIWDAMTAVALPSLMWRDRPSLQKLDRAVGSKGYFSKLFKKTNEPTVEVPKLQAIAALLKINYTWLATGEGRMNDPDAIAAQSDRFVEKDGRYPNLEAAIAYHQGRWSEHTLAASRSIARASQTDLAPAQWTKKLDALEAAIASVVGELPGKEVVEDEWSTPPAGRKRHERR